MRSKSPVTTNQNRFPFRRDNRRPDGFWDVADATEDAVRDRAQTKLDHLRQVQATLNL